MRTVAAVVALVVCVHAGLWMLLQRQQAVASIDAPLHRHVDSLEALR